VPVALVCDSGLTPGRIVSQLLDVAGLEAWIPVQTFSDEVGLPKPHRAPFDAALSSLGADPRRSLQIGDLRRADVQGGRTIGMATARIRAHHDAQSELPDADVVVDDHDDLRQMLGVLVNLRAG
jgi:putative hydrolase of the HAD superfamily